MSNTEFQNFRRQTFERMSRQSAINTLSNPKDISHIRSYYSFSNNSLTYHELTHREGISGRFLTSLFFQVWTSDFNFQNVRSAAVLDDFALFESWIKASYPSGYFRNSGLYGSCVSLLLGKLLDKVQLKLLMCLNLDSGPEREPNKYQQIISKPFDKARPKSVYNSLVKNV